MDTLLLISNLVLWPLTLINFLMIVGLARKLLTRQVREYGLPPGALAPELDAYTLDDRPASWEMVAGKNAVLVFLSPGCRSCRQEIPKIQRLHRQALEAGAELLIVSDGSVVETKEMLGSHVSGVTVLLAPAEKARLFADYRVRGTPAYCIVDIDKRIRASGLSLDRLGEDLRAFKSAVSRELTGKAMA